MLLVVCLMASYQDHSLFVIRLLEMLSEDINVEGTAVTVKKRLAEGGFGYIDLVTDSRTGAEYCVSSHDEMDK